MDTSQPSNQLRQRVLKGGAYLVVRQGLTVIVGLVGMTLLSHLIGPGLYGLYSAALGLFAYLQSIGLMGTHLYLVRAPQDTPATQFHLAFWWLLLWGIGLASCTLIGLWFVGYYWEGAREFVQLALAMCALLPLSIVAYVPLAQLERALNYSRVALIESSSTISFYGVAILLAWLYGGIWALVVGFWVSQIVLIGGFWGLTRFSPRWYWNGSELRTMLSYSVSQALSYWLYGVRELVPSLILLPLAGKEAVGYFALANRFVGILSAVMYATQRISVAAFAHVQDNLPRLTHAVTQAMQLQTLALGASFIGFMVVAPYALPLMLGERWQIETILLVFAILSIRYLLAAQFGVQGSALYVKKQNLTMLLANLAFAVALVLLSYGLMLLLPTPYRLYGFLAAEFLAHLPNYYLVDRGFRRTVGRPNYRLSMLWASIATCLILAPLVSYWLYLTAALMWLLPASRHQLGTLYREFRTDRAS